MPVRRCTRAATDVAVGPGPSTPLCRRGCGRRVEAVEAYGATDTESAAGKPLSTACKYVNFPERPQLLRISTTAIQYIIICTCGCTLHAVAAAAIGLAPAPQLRLAFRPRPGQSILSRNLGRRPLLYRIN
jgi:hypothetical protein